MASPKVAPSCRLNETNGQDARHGRCSLEGETCWSSSATEVARRSCRTLLLGDTVLSPPFVGWSSPERGRKIGERLLLGWNARQKGKGCRHLHRKWRRKREIWATVFVNGTNHFGLRTGFGFFPIFQNAQLNLFFLIFYLVNHLINYFPIVSFLLFL